MTSEEEENRKRYYDLTATIVAYDGSVETKTATSDGATYNERNELNLLWAINQNLATIARILIRILNKK